MDTDAIVTLLDETKVAKRKSPLELFTSTNKA